MTVLGGSGYSASELLRILARHPVLEVAALGAGRSAGESLDESQPHLTGLDLPDLVTIHQALQVDSEIVISCLPSDVEVEVDERTWIDLSDRHRGADGWLYGLTEHCRPGFPARRIANPGCYPTAVLSALIPFAQRGLIGGPIHVDALSGFSGAGRSATDPALLTTAHGDAGAYGTTGHRHIPEMERGLSDLAGASCVVSFTPHLIPMARGLVATIRAPLLGEMSDEDCFGVLMDAYGSEPFVAVIESWPHSKPTLGTNTAIVAGRVDRRAGVLVASAALDNLGKGAAGQAIQNANATLGLEEGLGLETVGVWP